MAVSKQQLDFVERHLLNALNPDPSIRNASTEFLLSFPVNNPTEFLYTTVTIAKSSSNVDAC